MNDAVSFSELLLMTKQVLGQTLLMWAELLVCWVIYLLPVLIAGALLFVAWKILFSKGKK